MHHEGCHLRGQPVVDYHVARPRLVEHRHDVALAERRPLGAGDEPNARDIALVTNGIAAYVAAYILYQAVVAYRHVAQHGIAYARMPREPLVNLDLLVKQPEADIAVKSHVMYVCRAEILGHANACPVFGRAALPLQRLNLVYCQRTHHTMFL